MSAKLAFVALLMATIVLGIVFCYVLQEYHKFFEGLSGLERMWPWYLWDNMPCILMANFFWLYAWGVFIWLFLSKKLKGKNVRHEISGLIYRFVLRLRRSTYEGLYGSVLHYFKAVNRKARRKLAFWYMKYETSRHVDLLIKVFKWVVLPASLLYVCADLYFFGRNALDSMFFGHINFRSQQLPSRLAFHL